MNFYLEQQTDGNVKRLNFPIVPNELSVTSGANTLPLNIIKTGEARIPRGLKATGYSWEGMMPGSSMKGAAFINTDADAWQEPRDIINILDTWMKNGTKLKFVAGKFVNEDVFIENFSKKFFGLNHCKYSITLTKYPTLTVSVSPAPKKSTSGGSSGGSSYPEGKVNKNKVAYRKGPGTKYKKLGKKNKGDKVTIYGTKGNWYKIKESPEWWISKSYVTLTSGKAEKKSGGGKKKSSGSKKPKSSTGSTGGKQPVKVTIPTSKLVKPQDSNRRISGMTQ